MARIQMKVGAIAVVLALSWPARGSDVVIASAGDSEKARPTQTANEAPITAARAVELAVAALRDRGQFRDADCNIRVRRLEEDWSVWFVFLPRISAGELGVIIKPDGTALVGNVP